MEARTLNAAGGIDNLDQTAWGPTCPNTSMGSTTLHNMPGGQYSTRSVPRPGKTLLTLIRKPVIPSATRPT